MKILHVIAGCWKDSGGPSEVVPNLCYQLQEQGHSVTLLTVDGDHSPAVLAAEKSGVNLVSLQERYFSSVRYVPMMYRYLKQNISDFDVVHNHGHWLYPNWITVVFCLVYKKPLVTTPHGTLVPGMLQRSAWKKVLAWAIFDRLIIRHSSVIHFLSENEKALSEQKIGHLAALKSRIIPNGASRGSKARFREQGQLRTKAMETKNLLFMGRVAEIKGIKDLLQAWCKLRPSSWKLTIIGPWDEDLRALRDSVEGFDSINILGPIYGNSRFEFLHEADAFVLPSYGEGLPTALLEAANNAKLILCSHECNFDSLQDAGGGYFFPCGYTGVVEALEWLFSSSYEERVVISGRAHKLACEMYSWEGVGIMWEREYSKVVSNC